MTTTNCCDNQPNEDAITVTELTAQELEQELTFYLNKESRSAERMDICKTCPELGALNRCSQCGCFMNIKTRIYSSQCPLGKW